MKIKERGHFVLLIAAAVLLAAAAFAFVPNGDADDGNAVGAAGEYNAGDVAVINSMIDNNGLAWTKAPADGSSVPDDWVGVSWTGTPKRIYSIILNNQGMTGAMVISDCTALFDFDLAFNGLTSLTVSGCTALWNADCGNNSLTSLTISGCTAMRDLRCGHNGLTSLNVSGCTALSYLDCSDNEMTSLDVHGLASLSRLNCSENKMTSLNISGCTNLYDVNCSYNEMTSLNVSGTSMVYLDCTYNFIGGPADVVGAAALPHFDAWDDGRFRFSPQKAKITVAAGDSVDKIRQDIQEILDNGFCPFVLGSKTGADKALVLDLYSLTVFWNAAYGGNALELGGDGIFSVEKDGSMTLTALRAEDNMIIAYGALTVNGDVTIEGEYGCLVSLGGTISVTGSVTAENADAGFFAVMAMGPAGGVTVGGSIVTAGCGIYADAGDVTVGGDVTAGGYCGIQCGGDSAVHVKGNLSAENGYAAIIYYDGTVKIDGTVTVSDDDEFIWDGNTEGFMSRSDIFGTDADGYDTKYADGNWSFLVGKQVTIGPGGDDGDGDDDDGTGGTKQSGGDGGGSNTLLIVAAIAAIAAAGGLLYFFVIRRKKENE